MVLIMCQIGEWFLMYNLYNKTLKKLNQNNGLLPFKGEVY